MSWNRLVALLAVLLSCCALADFVCLSPEGALFPAGLQVDDHAQWADGDFGRALYCSGSDADTVVTAFNSSDELMVLATLGATAAVFIAAYSLTRSAVVLGLMSIPAVKGVEIGAGFHSGLMRGSECNDIPYMKDGRVRFRTNNSGGIDGGITNGEDLLIRIAVKPTSTISIAQSTVNMATLEDAELAAITRRDATICGRMCAVAAAMTRITVLDHLMMWRGYDAVSGIEHKLGW